MNNTKTNNLHTGVDYLFWILFMFYSNSGGAQNALGINELGGGLNINDIIFVLFSILYFIKKPIYNIRRSRLSLNIKRHAIIYLFYMMLVFGILTPLYTNNYTSILFNSIKIRYIFYNISLLFFTYKFFIRNSYAFFQVFLIYSLLILVLFLQSLLTDINILPRVIAPRGFINLDRQMLVSYGFIQLLIPLGSIVIATKYSFNHKNLIIILYILMLITWIVSITRRHIIGSLFYLLIAFLLNNYIRGKRILSLNMIFKFISILLILVGLIFIITPIYYQSSIQAIKETLHVIKYAETTSGIKDERLMLSKDALVNKFKENPYFGTGYDQRWKTADKEGYESSDYPLLAAFAMAGIIGVLVFLPFYLFLIRMIIFDLKVIKKYKLFNQEHELYILLFLMLFFIYNLLQYVNWFSPISIYTDYTWFVCLGLYLASRDKLYNIAQIERST